MRIVIVGAGMVGTQLARHLIQEKHDVSLIEANEERARHASNRLDCLVLHAEGNSMTSLEEAGIARADALVCVTDSDELNMIIGGLAESRYPELLKIARVRNDAYDYLSPQSQERLLGIDHFVYPDVEAARSVLDAIEHGALGDVLAFSGMLYALGSIEIAAKSSFDGLALKDFRSLVQEDCLITLVERQGKSILPTGSSVLKRGDHIRILAKAGEMDRIYKLAGRTEKPLRKIGIVGGGRLGALIAEGLLERRDEKSIFSFLRALNLQNRRRVTIIEENYNRCKELSVRFPEALILNEDISDESFITEERIDDLDLIITATDHQELNMIAAVYLKSRGVERTIAIVTGGGYAAIARQLGVDVVIPMQAVVVDSILSHLMGGGITGVHRIGEEGNIGIIELEIGALSPAADRGIADLELPGGGLVMLVNRGGASFIPRGDYVFKGGDRIILITGNDNKAEIEGFFGASL